MKVANVAMKDLLESAKNVPELKDLPKGVMRALVVSSVIGLTHDATTVKRGHSDTEHAMMIQVQWLALETLRDAGITDDDKLSAIVLASDKLVDDAVAAVFEKVVSEPDVSKVES